MGVDVGLGGIGQSFLDSNMFSGVDPVSGHGVPAPAGIFSSGGVLLSAEDGVDFLGIFPLPNSSLQ